MCVNFYLLTISEEINTRVSAEEERQLMASMSKEWSPEPEEEHSRAIVEPQSKYNIGYSYLVSHIRPLKILKGTESSCYFVYISPIQATNLPNLIYMNLIRLLHRLPLCYLAKCGYTELPLQLFCHSSANNIPISV